MILMQILQNKTDKSYAVVDYETQSVYLQNMHSLDDCFNYCCRYVKPKNISINIIDLNMNGEDYASKIF